MRAVRARLRADFRRRWPAWFGLALAIGLGGGVVLTAAAGARRTATAYPRMLTENHSEDVYMGTASPTDPEMAGVADKIERLPQVVASARIAAMIIVPPSGPVPAPYHFAGTDERYGTTIDRPNIVAGRRADPSRADEVLVNRAMAKAQHLHVGSYIDWRTVRTDVAYAPDFTLTDGEKVGKPVRLKVVGIAVYPNEVVPTADYDNTGFMYLTPAYLRAHEAETQEYGFYVYRLRHGGADLPAFQTAVNRILVATGHAGDQGPLVGRAGRNAQVQRAIQPQVLALAAFAGLAAITFLLVIEQVIARRIYIESTDYTALRSIGMSKRELFLTPLVRVALVALVGGALAVAIAIAASPTMPIGPARLAEPHPGLAINVAMLGAGFVLLVGLVVGFAAIPARRAVEVVGDQLTGSGQLGRAPRPLPLGALANAGAPPSLLLGVRAALQSGRGRTSVPVRGALVASGLAIATVVAAFTFTANLSSLVGTPVRYGWNWDVRAGIGFFSGGLDSAAKALRAEPDVESVTGGSYTGVQIGKDDVDAISLDGHPGSIYPTLLAGRPAAGKDEIVLGSTTMRRHHLAVGDVVKVDPGDGPRPMRVVGQAVFPKMGSGSFSQTDLGVGAALTPSALPSDESGPPSYLLIRVRPGADTAALIRRINTRYVSADFCGQNPHCAVGAQAPGTIDSYNRVRSTPLYLSAALAIMAIGALGHVLVSSVRRRRRDLALLKTLGFVRRQVSAVTAWQATTMAVVALLIGIPVGLAVGRLAWDAFANQLGVAPDAITPTTALLLAIPATLLLANVIAAVPAYMAARTRPAVLERVE